MRQKHRSKALGRLFLVLCVSLAAPCTHALTDSTILKEGNSETVSDGEVLFCMQTALPEIENSKRSCIVILHSTWARAFVVFVNACSSRKHDSRLSLGRAGEVDHASTWNEAAFFGRRTMSDVTSMSSSEAETEEKDNRMKEQNQDAGSDTGLFSAVREAVDIMPMQIAKIRRRNFTMRIKNHGS